MDEARKLDIAQIAASEYARKNAESETYDVFGKQVAQVFKDAYEALGDKPEPKKYYDNSDQAEILSSLRKSYSGLNPTFADYAKVTTQVKQDTDAALKDLEAEKVAKYNEKVKASEQAIAQKYGMSDYERARDRTDLGTKIEQAIKSADEPKWTETPTKNGVYFIECPFNSMQARWVLVCLGFVSWFGDARSIHYTSSGITRFYGPMKAPE